MIHTGTILEISGNKAYVFTSQCDVVSVRSNESYIPGQQLTFSSEEICIEEKAPQLNIKPREKLAHLNITRGFLAAAAVFVLVISTLIYILISHGSTLFAAKNPVALISIDINPSIELSINGNGTIVDAVFGNDDGKMLLKSLDFKNKPIEEEIGKIISLAKENGYVVEGKTKILITGALYPTKWLKSESNEKKLKEILSSLKKVEGADVMVLYINDSGMISAAEEKDISIGKLALYKYAQKNNIDLSLEEIKKSSVTDLCTKLNVNESDYALVPSNNQKNFEANVTVAADNEKLLVRWNRAPAENGFSYYKVVASASNSNPVYPEDGYVLAISDINATEAALYPGCVYNGGDVGGALTGGNTYYISVTYVYENDKIRGNAVQATMPAAPSTPSTPQWPSRPSETPGGYYYYPETPVSNTIYPKISVNSSNTKLYFTWTPLCSSYAQYNGNTYYNFKYYKIVASKTNPRPVYPDDGYLYYTSDNSASSWIVDVSSKNYNLSPKLESGKTYYFSVTYVFENGKFSSNTVQYRVPEYSTSEPAVPTQSSSSLSVSSSGKTLNFSWSKLAGNTVSYNGTTYKNFQYYKVVASETNPNPVYPNDGYLYYSSEKSASSWSVDVTGKSYNQSPKLESGKTYYFSVTYVFENGKFSSNTVTYKVP